MRTFTSSVLPGHDSELDEDRLAGIIGGRPKKIIVTTCVVDEDGSMVCSTTETDA